MKTASDLRVVPIKPLVNDDLVDRLKTLLEVAEAGILTELIWAGVNSDGSTISGFTATDDAQRRLASACRLVHRLNVSMDDE